MEIYTTLKETWFSRKAPPQAKLQTLLLITILFVGAMFYIGNYVNSQEWMAASYESVFVGGDYWRLWTTLIAHGDFGHILGNLFMFTPFCYFLVAHFSFWVFPLVAFVLGGVINAIVLHTMPEHVDLVGVSGVVYWMGAFWVTLSFFIERKDSAKRRFIKVVGVSLILFFPVSLRENVSYLSHFVGFVLGIVSGFIVYFINRRKYRAAERWESHVEWDEEPPSGWNFEES